MQDISEKHTKFWWETVNEKHHLEDQVLHGNIILKWTLRKKRMCTGFIWLRIEAT
jgi:hypothetical protein